MPEQRLTSREKAASPTTSPEELWRLAEQYSKDKEILQAIVNNPNVPSKVLLQLGEQFPQEMLDNPVFDLLLLENPNLVAEMPVKMIISWLQLEEIPSFLKQGITRHKERIQIAKNRSTPAPILEILAQDDDLEVRRRVASNPNTPAPILEILHQDADLEVRCDVASNPNTSAPILEILSQVPDFSVRSGVASNFNTPAPILEILAQDADRTVRKRVENNPNTPAPILARYADYSIRVEMASNPDISVSILEILSQDTDVYIRGNVAINPNTPASILEILAQDTDGRVRRCVAESSNTPISTLEILAQDVFQDVRLRVVGNANTPVSTQEILAQDTDRAVCWETERKVSPINSPLYWKWKSLLRIPMDILYTFALMWNSASSLGLVERGEVRNFVRMFAPPLPTVLILEVQLILLSIGRLYQKMKRFLPKQH